MTQWNPHEFLTNILSVLQNGKFYNFILATTTTPMCGNAYSLALYVKSTFISTTIRTFGFIFDNPLCYVLIIVHNNPCVYVYININRENKRTNMSLKGHFSKSLKLSFSKFIIFRRVLLDRYRERVWCVCVRVCVKNISLVGLGATDGRCLFAWGYVGGGGMVVRLYNCYIFRNEMHYTSCKYFYCTLCSDCNVDLI